MRSLRGTLTVWYTVALAAAVLAFGLTITVLQRRAAVLAQEERLAALAGRVSGVLAQRAIDGHGPLVDLSFAPRIRQLRIDVIDQLSLIPGLVLVLDTTGSGVYGSPEVQRLTVAGTDLLRNRVASSRLDQQRFAITLDRTDYEFVAQRAPARTPSILAVAVGEPAIEAGASFERLGTSILLVLPLILLCAALLGYILSSRALRPVSQMIDELEAITDGRSLHRRLLAGALQAEELARLSKALNALLARLETSFDAMRRFVADASHELKTPLMVMRAGVERTLTDPKTSPEALLPLEETLVGVRHMTELVDALLTLARVDEGRMELHREPVNLGDLLAETFETAQILGEEAGVDVTLELPGGPVVVDADGGRIRQLVMNLVTNAVKYTPAGGKVWMTLTGTPQAATISVRDTGIGIAPGDVARVFDRFWRADPARSRTGERPGIGLGLAISKWIAEAHGGSIAVTSRPQRGTTFTVTLPRQVAEPGLPAGAASAVIES